MSIKITGMNSGLDTDAIIQELVSASSEKKTKLEKAQTKVEWTQTAWSDLNKKIKSFYSTTLSNLRFSTSFNKKKTTSSNSSVATVVAGDNAVKGSQSLVVKQLAKSGYLTGGKLSSNKSVKGSTKLSTLTANSGNGISAGDTASFSVTVKGKTTQIDLSGSTTIDDVVSKLSSAGVNASFDEANQRIFISVAGSGADNDFSLNANNVNGLKALSGLGLLTQEELDRNLEGNQALADAYDSLSGTLDLTAAESYITAKASEYAASMQSSIAAGKVQNYYTAIESLNKQWEESGDKEAYEKAVADYGTYDDVKAQRTTLLEQKEYLALLEKKNTLAPGEELSETDADRLSELEANAWASQDLDAEAIDQELTNLSTAATAFETQISFQNALDAQDNNIKNAGKNAKILNDYYEEIYADQLAGVSGSTYSEKLASVEADITAATAAGTDTKDLETLRKQLTTMVENEKLYTNDKVTADDIQYDAATQGITNRAITTVTSEAAAAYEMVYNADAYLGGTNNAVRVMGQDAVIELNGAEFTSSSNSFSINGLTISAKGLSGVIGSDSEGNPIYEETTLTTDVDIDGIYDTIRNFFTEYNNLIKEIDTLYNAESAKDYEPLTSEEKDAMTDDEIEKWEQKIKDALLRHDEDLNDVRDTLKQAMMTSFTVNGKSYNLTMFGINTQGYFNAADNERSMLHIDGDDKDSVSSGNKDLLKTMIASNPDVISGFFTQLAGSLYEKMQKMSQTSLNRSFGNFYDDKVLQNQYDDYKTKISNQETKLNSLEDRYYEMFSAMETQLSRINSTSNYISSMFG